MKNNLKAAGPAYEDVGIAIRNFNDHSLRTIERFLSPYGLSHARLRFITHIHERGSVRSADLMQAFGYAPRTVTEAIDLLERDGLAQRVPDLVDRRAKNVSLTKAGVALLKKVEPPIIAFATHLFAVLNATERKQLASLMNRLNAQLDAIDQGDGSLLPSADDERPARSR